MTTDSRTEAGQIVETAQIAVAPRDLDPGAIYQVTLPGNASSEIIDLEAFLPVPNRKRERVTLYTADSFSTYVKRHQSDAACLYADEQTGQVVAVLNDSTTTDAGWGDHRATLKLRATKPWQHWTGMDNRLVSQTDFAEHIEAGLTEIIEPAAAAMLELAQSFEANSKVAFKSARRLASGERQFTYTESIEASAGASGEMTVPSKFTLAIAPFEGSNPYKLEARLRYRINEGKLTLGYVLDRPEEVLQAAFVDILRAIEDKTELVPFRGTPPTR